MKITFVCAVFPPEPLPSGVMAHQLATRLARDGHVVTMVTPFPNRPHGVTFAGFRRRLRSREVTKEGYTLVRCANWLIGKKRRNLNRLLENITFGLSSAWAAWRAGRPDVLIIETWPLVAVQIVAILARWWRVPYLYYVKDVYPEAAESAGIVHSGGALARACRAWDRRLCLKSASVVVISESMLHLIAKSRELPRDLFTVIPDWIDESAFVCAREMTWRRSNNIPGSTFVAMFAGTLGHVSGAEVLVEVAQILRDQKNTLILCIGEGVRKQAMIDACSRLRLENMRFLPFQPAELVPEVQASSDVALLTMQPHQSDASVPSKLITYLAAGRPVVCAANADSAVARAVLDAGAGLVVPPGDAQAIAAAILRITSDPEGANQMRRNARLYFERQYTLERAHGQFSQLIHRVRTGKSRGKMSGDLLNGDSANDTTVPSQRRILGRLLAFLTCVLGLPIHLVICACVILADRGAPLYRDERIGRLGRPFSMLKYRTMKINCESLVRDDCKMIVEANDPRVTVPGRLLRCGIDELAQLWNIVRGEMAWVGPRPDKAWMLPLYGPLARQRLSSPPGITGLAQVLGSRNLSNAERYAIELWYVTHRSFWLDAWVVAVTPLFIAGWSTIGRSRLERLRATPDFQALCESCEGELASGAVRATGLDSIAGLVGMQLS